MCSQKFFVAGSQINFQQRCFISPDIADHPGFACGCIEPVDPVRLKSIDGFQGAPLTVWLQQLNGSGRAIFTAQLPHTGSQLPVCIQKPFQHAAIAAGHLAHRSGLRIGFIQVEGRPVTLVAGK